MTPHSEIIIINTLVYILPVSYVHRSCKTNMEPTLFSRQRFEHYEHLSTLNIYQHHFK